MAACSEILGGEEATGGGGKNALRVVPASDGVRAEVGGI